MISPLTTLSLSPDNLAHVRQLLDLWCVAMNRKGRRA